MSDLAGLGAAPWLLEWVAAHPEAEASLADALREARDAEEAQIDRVIADLAADEAEDAIVFLALSEAWTPPG